MSRIYQQSKPASSSTTSSASVSPSASSSSVNRPVNNLTNSSNAKIYTHPTAAAASTNHSNTATSTSSSLSSSTATSSPVTNQQQPQSPKPNLNHDIKSGSNQPNGAEQEKMAQDLQKLISRLETVTNRLENIAPIRGGSGSTSAPTTNGNAAESFDHLPSIAGFDDLINNSVNSFVQLSSKIGADVKTIADLVEKLFQFERSFLVEAARSTQPSQDVLAKFYTIFSKHIEEIQGFREKNRKSEFFNHLSAISESIGALGWIAIQPAPSPYVKEMSDAAQFYTNRVLKDYKEKDATHASWVKQWLQLLSELQAYVKQHHTTGVVWNSTKKSGVFDPSNLSGGSKSSSASSAPAAPPGGPLPPPPPPMPNFNELLADQGNQSKQATTDALFAELNKGSDITKHLKQVTDDQKTHKNPALRGGSTVPGSSNPSPANSISKATAANAIQKPPVFELVDKKWKIEFQKGQHNLVVDQTDLKHTVYVYQCKESTITVKGKVNSILIDSCDRVGLLFDDVLSTVEFINSKNVTMQVLGRVPTVSIEKTDGCQVYLSKNSLDTEIVSSKSSAMNILIPNANDDEFTENPVPEQYKTVIKDRKLITTPSESV